MEGGASRGVVRVRHNFRRPRKMEEVMRERFKLSWLLVAVLLAMMGGAYAQIGPDRLAARIGDLPVNLVTRPGQCFLDEQQPTDRKMLDEFFRPRQGNLNTLLAAFMPCQQRAAFRESRF